MKKYRLATALATILVVAALLSVGSMTSMSAAGAGPTKVVIYLFSAQSQSNGLHLSWTLVDERNMFASGDGTARLTIESNESGVVFQGSLNFLASDFHDISTSVGQALGMEWNLTYGQMGFTSNKAMTLTCTLSVSLSSGATATSSTGVTIPQVPSIVGSSGIITGKTVSPYDMEGMMGEGELDGAITYEPWASDMVRKNEGKVLLRSSDIWPNHPSYVMLMDSRWAQRNPDLAARVLRAEMDASNWIINAMQDKNSTNYTMLVDQASNFTGFPTKVVIEALNHVNYSIAVTNQTEEYLTRYVDGYLEEGLVTNQMLVNRSYQSAADFTNAFVNLTYLNNSQQMYPTGAIVGNISLGYANKNLFMLPCAVALNASIWGGVSVFEKYGLQVNLPQPNGYNTSALIAQDMIMGNLTVAYMAVCPAILSHLQLKARTVMVSQVAAEGTALLVNKNVNSFNELGGRIVGHPDIVTIQNLMLRDLAKKNGMTVEEAPTNSTGNSTK